MFISLIRYLLFIFIFLSLGACFGHNSKTESKKLYVEHVYVSGLPDPYDGSRPDLRYDFYYVYNYTEADFQLFLNMLDTLTVDRNYKYHSHTFLKYDESLPDKKELNNPNFPQGDRLIYEDFHENTILDFLFCKSTFVRGSHYFPGDRVRPDYYMIITFEGDKIKENYFLKDSVTGKFKEVKMEDIHDI